MKKLKLKGWVKVVIIALILVGIAKIGADMDKKHIEDCMEAGHSYQYCYEGLK